MIDEILQFFGLNSTSSPDSPTSPPAPSSPDSPTSPPAPSSPDSPTSPPAPSSPDSPVSQQTVSKKDAQKDASKSDEKKNKFIVVEKSGFRKELEGVKLNEGLIKNFRELSNYLIANDLVNGNITLNENGGVRSPKTAHKWSTAWSIRNDKVPLQNLKELSDGKDLDGNLWYVQGETMEDVKKRALTYWNGAQAAEGYSQRDPRKKPNTFKGVSKHCSGEAIDATIPWKNGDGWHEEAVAIIDRYNLERPVPKERWHFQNKN